MANVFALFTHLNGSNAVGKTANLLLENDAKMFQILLYS